MYLNGSFAYWWVNQRDKPKGCFALEKKTHKVFCINAFLPQHINWELCKTNALLFNPWLVMRKQLPSLPPAFTLLIPGGRRASHSWHADLGPSSVTYYRRLLCPQSFPSESGARQPVPGQDDETRLTRTNTKTRVGFTGNFYFEDRVVGTMSAWAGKRSVFSFSLPRCANRRETRRKQLRWDLWAGKEILKTLLQPHLRLAYFTVPVYAHFLPREIGIFFGACIFCLLWKNVSTSLCCRCCLGASLCP